VAANIGSGSFLWEEFLTLYRLIAPDWAVNKNNLKKVLEGYFSDAEIAKHNASGYNIYYLPNYPSQYEPGTTVDGSHIDTFNWCFVDCDLKDGIYDNKDQFLNF